MVVPLLPMGLNPTRRRLVVGRRLRLFQVARPARTPSATATTATDGLVVPTSVSATLSASVTDSDATAGSDSHTHATGKKSNAYTSGPRHTHANISAKPNAP